MRHLVTTLSLLALVLAAAPASAGVGELIGKWSAKRMEAEGKTRPLPEGLEIFVAFENGGKFSAIMKAKGQEKESVKTGRWKMDKDVLVTVVDGTTEKMHYKVDGSKLTLTKLPGKQRMHLEKVKSAKKK